MNEDILKGKWKQLKGSIKDRWGKLTDDEIDQIEGDSEKLAGKIQEKYGKSKEEAKEEVEEYKRNL